MEVVYQSLLSMNRGLGLRRHSAQVKLYCTENIVVAPSSLVPPPTCYGVHLWAQRPPTDPGLIECPQGPRRFNRHYYYVDGSPREPVVRFGSPTDPQVISRKGLPTDTLRKRHGDWLLSAHV